MYLRSGRLKVREEERQPNILDNSRLRKLIWVAVSLWQAWV